MVSDRSLEHEPPKETRERLEFSDVVDPQRDLQAPQRQTAVQRDNDVATSYLIPAFKALGYDAGGGAVGGFAAAVGDIAYMSAFRDARPIITDLGSSNLKASFSPNEPWWGRKGFSPGADLFKAFPTLSEMNQYVVSGESATSPGKPMGGKIFAAARSGFPAHATFSETMGVSMQKAGLFAIGEYGLAAGANAYFGQDSRIAMSMQPTLVGSALATAGMVISQRFYVGFALLAADKAWNYLKMEK